MEITYTPANDNENVLLLYETAKAEKIIEEAISDFQKATNLLVTEIKVINIGFTKNGPMSLIKIFAPIKIKNNED